MTARSALADPAIPVRNPIVLLRSHLSTMRRLLDDVAAPGAVAGALTAHRNSSRRLRRLEASTLRTSLAQQIKAHLEIERELLARIDPLLSPADMRALTGRYRRLMVLAAADPPLRPSRRSSPAGRPR